MPLLMCPNDNAAMQTLERSGVQFDMCPTCRGVWRWTLLGCHNMKCCPPGGSVHGERASFRVLVLLCIDASDSETRLIFQHFSRSPR